MHRIVVPGLLLIVFLCGARFGTAQLTDVTNETRTPVPGAGHDYFGLFSEIVDPSTGSVSLRIHVPMPPGRRLTLPFSFDYDSNDISVSSSGSGGFTSSSGYMWTGGWSYSVPIYAFMSGQTKHTNARGQSWLCHWFSNFTFRDPQGGRHNLGLYTQPSPQGGFGCSGQEALSSNGPDFEASIKSGGGALYLASADGTAYFFGGNQLEVHEQVPNLVEDRNGNEITITDSGNGAVTYADTVGRTVLSTSGFGTSGNTVTVSGLPAPYTVTWGSTSYSWGGNGGWTLIKYGGIGVCNAPVATSGTVTAISAIQLPNGKKYAFSYDPNFGHISKITYPTGGYVSYTWSINSQSVSAYYPDSTGDPSTPCLWRWGIPAITKRVVSYDGSTIAEEQDFAYSTPSWSTNQNSLEDWTQKGTVVTTKDLVRGNSFVTTYVYSPSTSGEPSQPFAPIPNPVDIFVPVESTITYQNTNGTTLRTVNKTWLNAQQLSTEQDTLNDGPNPITSETTYTYDAGNQLHEKDEYDFGQSSPTRETVINHQSFPATPLYAAGPSIFDRPCQSIVYDNTSGTPVRVSETDYFYDNGATSTPCGTAGTPSVTGVSSLTAHDETNYGPSSTAPRGNLTQKTVYLNTGGSSPVTTYTYDETGQLLSATDPCGNATCSDMTATSHTTTYSYADSFSSGSPSGTTNAYLTGISYPTTSAGVTQTQSFTYSLPDGQLTSAKDQNGQVTSYKYNTPPSGCSTSDGLDRLSEIDFPDTGKTTYCYNDTAPSPSVATTKLAGSSPAVSISTTAVSDGMAHVVQTQLTSDPDGTDLTDTSYDGLGRVLTRSNPHRSASSPTDGTTTYTYDSLGRTTLVSEPDGSKVTTAYAGNQTTVTDEVGNQRTSQSDGLGRLTKVFEAPNQTGFNFETDYQYDVLNNLICGVQKGTDTTAFSSCSTASATWRPRSFIYDSLSRLTSAANPESGTINYTYDANGNVATKVAPAPNQTGTSTITTGFTYDALNRVTIKGFTPAMGTFKYIYDGVSQGCPSINPPTISSPTNRVGRLSARCAGQDATSFSYDPTGRVSVEKSQHGTSVTKTVNYAYNLDGSLKTLTYPSGDVVTYATSGAGRTTNVSDPNNNSFVAPPGTGPMYTAGGLLVGAKNGAAISVTNAYNNRLQPVTLSAATSSATLINLGYNFHLGSGDNGDVFGITNSVDTTRSTAFAYDALNRIQQANTTTTTGNNCWGEVYTVDPWGNLTNRAGVTGMTGCATEGLSQAASVNNQLTGMTYDAAGNVTNDGNGNTPTYDDLGETISDAGVTYSYDADGQRIEKSSGTFYWYGSDGEVLAESDLSGNINEEYIFFNGQRIARVDRPSGTVHYYFADNLGSASVIADASGNVQEQYFYYPYGGIVAQLGSDSNHYKFTGKERDGESGLDSFGARYDASSMGRFMTPDWAAKPTTVPYAEFGDPQSLNLYSYVRNNPLSRFDPDGHCADHYQDGSCKVNVDPKTGDAGAKAGKQLEGVLNKYDKAINALGDKSKFDIKDSKGNVIGSLTGKEIKAVWNGTSFTVTSQTDFHNGGAGGGTGGTWNGDSFSGHSSLSPGAVSAYSNAASARDEAPLVGLSTLTFHELGHETHFGEALTQQYPVTPTISGPRERGASSAGSRIAGTVDAPFDCSITGGCQ